jgi:hypothetical protein
VFHDPACVRACRWRNRRTGVSVERYARAGHAREGRAWERASLERVAELERRIHTMAELNRLPYTEHHLFAGRLEQSH